MAISNSAIGPTNTTIYTSSGNNAITTIIVCNSVVFDPANPTANESKLYMWAVPSGQGVTDLNLIVNGLPVPAGETVSFDQEKMVLANGDRLIARSDSPANLVVTVSTLAV